MASKDEIAAIREAADGLLGEHQAVADIRALLGALDAANARIADLEAETRRLCVSAYEHSEEARLYCERGRRLEAKLAKIREWEGSLEDFVLKEELHAILDNEEK